MNFKTRSINLRRDALTNALPTEHPILSMPQEASFHNGETELCEDFKGFLLLDDKEGDQLSPLNGAKTELNFSLVSSGIRSILVSSSF